MLSLELWVAWLMRLPDLLSGRVARSALAGGEFEV
jgi:hypothetical protein